MTPKFTGEFWKSIGGYLYCAKANGRWHFVGIGQEGIDRMRLVFDEMKAQGVKLHRVGSFAALERLYAQHGNSMATLQRLPLLEWAKREVRLAEARRVVAASKCPQCGSGLRRNNSLAGWWQCKQFGSEQFRERPADPPCSFQIFTE